MKKTNFEEKDTKAWQKVDKRKSQKVGVDED